MNIALVEPFFGGSHQAWARQLQRFSSHRMELFTLKANHWKWRMHGGAVTLAQQFIERDFRADLILATDMLDVGVFQALTRTQTADLPFVLYMHENQLTYPWSPTDPDTALNREMHYGFINYTSALAATQVWFNSLYHRDSFLNGLPGFLKQFPDHQNTETIDKIRDKCMVMPLGLDLSRFDLPVPPAREPIILWNHRWEYDKNPEGFFNAIREVKRRGVPFKLCVLGEQYTRVPEVFEQAKKEFESETVHWGYLENGYEEMLHRCSVLPVTSHQDFFGISVVEATYCGCVPLVPNRLSYPGHFNEYPHLFYHTDEELVEKIIEVLTGQVRGNGFGVQRNDWKTVIGRYDSAFEALIQLP